MRIKNLESIVTSIVQLLPTTSSNRKVTVKWKCGERTGAVGNRGFEKVSNNNQQVKESSNANQ